MTQGVSWPALAIGVLLALSAVALAVGITMTADRWERIPYNDPECVEMRSSGVIDCGVRENESAKLGLPLLILGLVGLAGGGLAAFTRHTRARAEG